MTVTSGPTSYDGNPPPRQPRRTRVLPARVALLLSIIVVLLIITSTSSIRTWWAHRLHDVTSGSWTADYVIGLVVGLLPVIGVVLGALRARGPRRAFRMFVFGALGFVLTYLVAPSPASWLAHQSASRVFDRLAPGYLAGVFTAIMLWLAFLVIGVARARARWRRFRDRALARHAPPDGPPTTHRVIDV